MGYPADRLSIGTDARGVPLQNPTLQLDETASHVEYRYFSFLAEATPAA